MSIFFFWAAQTGPTKDRKGLLPPRRTEKNFRAPKKKGKKDLDVACHAIKTMLMIYRVGIYTS